jgi:hypothetical protein
VGGCHQVVCWEWAADHGPRGEVSGKSKVMVGTSKFVNEWQAEDENAQNAKTSVATSGQGLASPGKEP